MRYGKTPVDPGLALRPNLLKWLDTPRLQFKATNQRAAAAWQRRARKAFADCLGNPPRRVPLRANILEEKKLDGYTRTTFTLDTAPSLRAICWYCVPHDLRETPGPAMIATPGHGMGAKDLLAMTETGTPRPEGLNYQKDYALQVVRLGYPCLVVEPLGFGERRDTALMQDKTAESGCVAGTNLANMLGTTLAAIRINDLRRGLDWLTKRKEVDAGRIGLMGISGGGQMTLWTSALEPRIKVAIVSGYVNTFADSIMAMHHCPCNVVPGLAATLDMSDIAALVAPRPLLIESGTKDAIFPIKATRRAVRAIRNNYDAWDARKRVEHDVFEGEHQWSGRRVEKFLARYL